MARSKGKSKQKHKHYQQRTEPAPISTKPAIGDGESSETNRQQLSLPYTVGSSATVGRYLEAACDLPAGELILKEKPLVVGPSQDSKSLCIGCYCTLSSEQESSIYRCKNCSFPLCSPSCAGTDQDTGHSQAECEYLAKSSAMKLSTAKELLTHLEAITPLRCLYLKSTNPCSWSIVYGMEPHTTTRKMIPTLWSNNQMNVVDVIRKTWGLEEFSEEEIHHVCGVLEVNAFEVGSGLRALYPTAFLFAHDCVPNTRHSDNVAFNTTFWTAIPVQKGEMLTVTYTYILQGTAKRRKHLRDTKFFDCQCRRCRDPTEFGTNISALKCAVCKHGLVESTNPLDPTATWSCKGAQCSGYVLDAAMVDTLTQRIFRELDSIKGNDIPGLENALEKYTSKLHANHYLCLSALHCLFQLYGKIEGYLINDLTDQQLLRKIEICQILLEAFSLLEPGFSKQRGLILYELQAPMMVLLQRDYKRKSIGKVEIKNRLKTISKCLEESNKLLKVEAPETQEAGMAQAAVEALQSLEPWKELIKRL